MVRRIKRLLSLLALLLLLGFGAGAMWFRSSLAPLPKGADQLFRWPRSESLSTVLKELESKKVIRSASALGWFAKYKRTEGPVRDGTYSLRPGMTAEEVLKALQKPLRQLVRIPEGWWIAQVGKRLEEKNVCSAEEYVKETSNPASFQDAVKFKLPRSGSLEGYLFPDTYDFPPLIGAREVIQRMLQNFEKKVVAELPKNADLRVVLTKASMVEREVKVDSERPIVAGVINNRLAKGMTLDLDATVLYGIQDWRVLGRGEVRKLVSEYNTYLHKGLPPGPIGSPSLKSIEAVLKPAQHNYLYYVAKPDGTHTFTTNYDDHRAAIRTNRRMAR